MTQPIDLHERLALYEPMVDQMLKDIRTARDAQDRLQEELHRVKSERDVVLREVMPKLPDHATEAMVEEQTEFANNSIRERARQFREIQELRAELTRLNGEMARYTEERSAHEATQANLRSEIDERKATEAKLEPARKIVVRAKEMVDDGLKDEQLEALIKAYDNV